MTNKEWVSLLEENLDNLIKLVEQFHPAGHPARLTSREDKFVITAKDAEKICQSIREKIAAENDNSGLYTFLSALKEKDYDTVHSVLNETWFGLPESVQVRRLPGFYALCDLCSEYGIEE